MAEAFLVGGAVRAAFGELLKLVLDEGKKIVMFKSELKRIETTLISIQPMFDGIEKSNSVLIRPKEETDMFVDRLRNAKDLILKCSRIQSWNAIKRSKYANKLIELDESMLRFFQMDVQAQLACDTKKILVAISDNSDKLGQILSRMKYGDGGICSSSWFPGSCAIRGLPDLFVESDLPLKELKEMLLEGDKPVLLSARAGCGKTTLAKMLCHDEEIKGIFGSNIFFVTVSQTASLKGIALKLFEHNGLRPPEFLSDEHAINQLKHLILRLIFEKTSILLVLDDAWSEWESLIEHLMFRIRGYKILVTSRFVFPRFYSTYKLKIFYDRHAMTHFHQPTLPRDWSSNRSANLMKKAAYEPEGTRQTVVTAFKSSADYNHELRNELKPSKGQLEILEEGNWLTKAEVQQQTKQLKKWKAGCIEAQRKADSLAAEKNNLILAVDEAKKEANLHRSKASQTRTDLETANAEIARLKKELEEAKEQFLNEGVLIGERKAAKQLAHFQTVSFKDGWDKGLRAGGVPEDSALFLEHSPLPMPSNNGEDAEGEESEEAKTNR